MKLFILTFSLLLFSCAHIDSNENLYPEGPLADGCPGATYPDWKKSPYVLPYPVGKTYKVVFSNCSDSYHSEGRPDQFAIDFSMEPGTLVTAARAGIVEYVLELGYDNFIVINHGDNTYGHYLHLTRKGILVEVGQTITQGDSIGLSGATGLAGYPHLHFVVTIDDYKWPYESIPVTFRNTLSNVNGLKSHTEYTAY